MRKFEALKSLLLLLLSLSFVLTGCAIPVKMVGTTGNLSWTATELSLQEVAVENSTGEQFGFQLLLQEKQGQALQLTRVEFQVWQDNVDRSDTLYRNGPWTLPPYGNVRIPFAWAVYCPPATVCPDTGNSTEWNMTFFGKDANNQPVEFPMTLILPWVPPR